MTTRQLSLKRGVYDFKKGGMEIITRNLTELFVCQLIIIFMLKDNLQVFKEFIYNSLMRFVKEIPLDIDFGPVSNEDINNGIMDWTKVVPSDIEFEIECVSYISSIVQYFKDMVLIKESVSYKFLTREILPEMWRSRKGIELKRQRKLENLANLLDSDKRYQEAHVIRIIVKPHLERVNRKWTNMTALEKFKSLFS